MFRKYGIGFRNIPSTLSTMYHTASVEIIAIGIRNCHFRSPSTIALMIRNPLVASMNPMGRSMSAYIAMSVIRLMTCPILYSKICL